MGKKVEWKEFCSGCRQHYTMIDGVWKPCPSCDGLGNKLSTDAGNEKTADYLEVRKRWNIDAR